ncbi:MAG TPA: hypothetical protein PLD23_21045, partial [Armatimonadota bacterium]|nr:hypothetical protein [Armatimonadota bacterium]
MAVRCSMLTGSGVLSVLAAACLAVTSKPDPGPARASLRIVYTIDTGGQISTCGCSGGQHGGLARRASLLKALALDGVPLVVLDGGSVVTSASQSPYFAEAYAAMRYSLVIPSQADVTARDGDGNGLSEALNALGVAVLARPIADAADPLPSAAIDVAQGWRLLALAAPEGALPLPALAARARQAVAGVDRARTAILLATRLEPGANRLLAQELGDAVDVIVGDSTSARSRDYRDPIPEGKVVPAIS